MELDPFTERAHALALAEEASQVPGFGGLGIEASRHPHPLLEGAELLLSIRDGEADPASGAPRYEVVLHHGSLADDPAVLERALLFGLERVAERAAADEAVATDEALFQAHAGFLRGMEVPAGWYRRGERLATDVWVVDLDVFVDLVLSRETWNGLAGRRATLRLLDDKLELEMPEDAEPDEAWTLEGAGLFEPAAGRDKDDDLAEEDGRYGDLHIVPYVY